MQLTGLDLAVEQMNAALASLLLAWRRCCAAGV